MADSLSTIRTNLRFRLGETTAGTWTDNELRDALHLAERKICEDAILQDKAILTSHYEIALEGDTYQYTLPSDLIDIILLQHYHDGTFYTLRSHPIASMLDRFDPESTASILTHYAIHDSVALILDEGVCTQDTANDSNTIIEDARAAFSSTATTIDEAVNVTDGSRATISTVDSNTKITTAGLAGGATNLFRAGDKYQIESGEQYLPLLWIWPPLASDEDTTLATSYTTGDDGNLTIGDTGGTEYRAAQSFQVDEAIQLHSVQIELGAEEESPIGPIRVELQTNTAGAPSGTLVSASDPESASTISDPDESGWNEATFEEGVRLAADTTYWIVVYARDQDTGDYYTWRADTTSPTYTTGNVSTSDDGGSTWTADTAKDAMFKLYGFAGSESLHLHYARYPRKMTNTTDLSELPMYAYEAMYLFSEYQCYLKRYGRGNARTAEALALYGDPRDGPYGTGEIGKVKRLLARRGEQGFRTVRSSWLWGRRFPTHKNVPINVRLPLE